MFPIYLPFNTIAVEVVKSKFFEIHFSIPYWLFNSNNAFEALLYFVVEILHSDLDRNILKKCV